MSFYGRVHNKHISANEVSYKVRMHIVKHR